VDVLIQFLLRTSFGLALAMALVPPRLVTSGYYRVHSYVVMGMCTLAALVALASPQLPMGIPLTAAVLAYVSSAVWLYERPRPGIVLLWCTAAVSLWGAWTATALPAVASSPAGLLTLLDPVTGGLVLGSTLAAMFLGHWYLNTPTMELAPLRRLLLMMMASVALRALVAGTALALTLAADQPLAFDFGLMVALRWLAGIAGVMTLAWMSWQTLKIPNTQSATGILYVAVIGAFVGELTSQLLSSESVFPV
jgi:hypothetical protein